MSAVTANDWLGRARLARLADYLMIAVIASLPWSTSATLILVALWLLALLPTLSWSEARRELLTAAGGLPVLLTLLGILGMAWADVSLIERWKGLDSFIKLLVVPLAFMHFRKSDRGEWALGAFLVSCVVLLVVSYVYALLPGVFISGVSHGYGVPVKNGPGQSGEFVICIFGMAYLAQDAARQRQWRRIAVLAIVMLAMLINIVFVATSRTALLTVFVLLALFALKWLSARGRAFAIGATVLLCVAAWFSSPYLRLRVTTIWTDYQRYEKTYDANSSGERVAFYERSIEFIRSAPVIGHGTGSIPALFRQAALGEPGALGRDTTNPHNQTFAVAIQLGLVGAAVLWAMWITHIILFRGASLADWVGLLIVVQNVVGSLLNSHLFDFQQGWIYVLGVGIAGGMVLKGRDAAIKPSARAG